jgi:hypothetical protein
MHGSQKIGLTHCFLFVCLSLVAWFVPLGTAQDFKVGERPASPAEQGANLYTIHSNFARHGNCFDLREGWLVGDGQYIAMPFTPLHDAKVTTVVMALLYCEYGCGPDSATVSLNQDDGGLPGQVMHTWKLHNLGKQKWHSCSYTMTVARSKNGISLKMSQQYWLVAEAQKATTLSWAYTYKDTKGSFAYEQNEGGWLPNVDYLSAFGVFGISE